MKSFRKKYILLLFVVLVLLFIYLFLTSPFTCKEEFDNQELSFNFDIDLIQKTIQNDFPSVKINKSVDIKRVTADDMKSYKTWKKWVWDNTTQQLYRDFLEKQGYLLNNKEFNVHLWKLRAICNQRLILELLFLQTDHNQLFQNGLLVNVNNEILQPVRQNWKDYFINNDTFFGNKTNRVIKCDNNNQLKMFEKSKDAFTKKDYQGRDILADLFASSIQYVKGKCNPCESNHSCQYKIKFKNNFEDDLLNKIWQ
jgi:hypothetical protein